MKPLRNPTWLGLVAGLLWLAGCGAEPEPDLDAPQSPLACLTIGEYGNAALCEDSIAGRDTCGSNPDRICAAGWLCFHDPRVAFCTCKIDEDCQRRAGYINQGRALRKMAPIPAKCVAQRCVGLP